MASTSHETTPSTSGTDTTGGGSAVETSTQAGADTTAGGSGVTTDGADSSTSATGGPSTSTESGDTATTASGESSGTGAAPMCPDAPVAGSGLVTQAISVGPSVYVNDVEVDSDGNIFIAGPVVNGEFGAATLVPATPSMYLAKYDSSLNPLWAQLGDENSVEWASIEVDDNGDVIRTGVGLQKINGASGLVEWTSTYVEDMTVVAGGDVVVRLGSVLQRRSGADASVIWETTIPALDSAGFLGLDGGSDGVLLTSRFAGTIPTASGDVSSENGETNTVVLSVDLAGDLEWGYTIVGQAARVRDIAVDPCGGAYVYGELNGIADFGTVGGGAGVEDLFLVHLDEGGTLEWLRVYDGTLSAGATSVAVDSEGSALLTGWAANLNVGGFVLGGGSSNGFVAKVNRDGDALWATEFHTEIASSNTDVTVDAFNNPIVVGMFTNPITIGDFSFTPDNVSTFVATMEP